MKVYNLTDVETETLKRYGLFQQGIVVGTEVIAPGGEAEVDDTPETKAKMEHLVSLGALSYEKRPPPYVMAKSQPGQVGSVRDSVSAVKSEPSTPGETEPTSEDISESKPVNKGKKS